MIRLIRRWLKTSAPIADISAETVSEYLQGSPKPGQFAVFQLPDRNSFAQFKRQRTGGLLVEVSKRSPQLEALLAKLGDASISDDQFRFPIVVSRPGDDSTVAQVIASALATLATEAGVPNITRVRTGAQLALT
jgi:hypothetical protein